MIAPTVLELFAGARNEEESYCEKIEETRLLDLSD